MLGVSMMKKINVMFVVAVFLLIPVELLFAAVGCDLNDPDRDVARLFPGSTGYKTNYVAIDQRGGPSLLEQIEDRLGDKFKGLFETIDVPYTLYEVFKGKDKIGYIHGVNEKGQYGGIQVFVVLDLEGVIKSFYFQKLTSRYGKQLRDPKFGEQFVGLSLKDFYNYDVQSGKTSGPSAVEKIKNPVPEAEPDFRAALRGTKKNLILVDEFILGNKYLQYHQSGGEQNK
ncbi:MAG: hypothetical protein QG552_3298 [Thermodesulfobacteriota bacterium]|nr:hypothetical protein [Thermodesulfobacteriota bacterium]